MHQAKRAFVCCMLLGAACGSQGEPKATETPSVRGQQTYRVKMDGGSGPEENLVFGAYFPRTIKAHAGDTLIFENLSSHDIHTVTFGVKADRSNSPKPETKAVQANPAVFRSCFTDHEPTPDWEACRLAPGPSSVRTPASAPPYSGRGYWNSGVVLPRLLAGEGGETMVSVRLSDAIPSGSYSLVCLIHPFMNGALEVVPKGGDRPSPEAVSKAGAREFKKAQAWAAGLKEPTGNIPGVRAVIAGWGDELISVDRFTPSKISIKVGDTVTWINESPYMPHTVSFDTSFKGPEDTNAFLPAGEKSGGLYKGGIAHSGMIGPSPPFPASSFSLKFMKAGAYEYVCILHPGMTGTVEVGA